MCGIVAVLTKSDDCPASDPQHLAPVLLEALQVLSGLDDPASQTSQLRQAADLVRSVDHRLRSLSGVRRLVEDLSVQSAVRSTAQNLARELSRIDALLDTFRRQATPQGRPQDGPPHDSQPQSSKPQPTPRPSAALNEAIELAGQLADSVFAIARDRLRTATAIAELYGADPPSAAIAGLWAIQVALSSLDRLEVRGRDSAGLQIFIAPPHTGLPNTGPPNTGTGTPFIYKVAEEIGELGDNTVTLRQQISQDKNLHAALNSPGAQLAVLAHTRWASVGIISEPNAHPLDGNEANHSNSPAIHCSAVLNGDVDNYADLKELNGLQIAPEVTTDAKVIPTLLRRSLEEGQDLLDAFVATVDELDGSVAVAAHSSTAPDNILLALRGSGQALYVGATERAYIVASEPYGLVEEVDQYLRMSGDTSVDPTNPVGSRGQIILLDLAALATAATPVAIPEVVRRISYDGTPLAVESDEIATAKITTRDIDIGDAPHFFLKEIREAPRSFRTTLRGRIQHHRPSADQSSQARPHSRITLDELALPPDIRSQLGSIKNIVAIGQGTAAVAASALPHLCELLLTGENYTPPQVSACLATELSGFGLEDDMSDTLVVAVSQSGTTTDLNRTVDLARERGAAVIAIVNRRNSDLTERADGVLYTSDGRDVEMSVASTKAFYAQVAAVALLAGAIAQELDDSGADSDFSETLSGLLQALEAMPDAIEEVLMSRAEIAQAARQHVGPKRHWAVVGNGANVIAAREIRIKLSELCYHAVAEDSTENKKHIDLSSEPLILVCAVGAPSSVEADVAKEIDIYRAHRSNPVVFASRGSLLAEVPNALTVPAVHPALDFVLATVAGHLFAYEAALMIDSLATPLRAMRVVVEAAIGRYMSPTDLPADLLADVANDIEASAQQLAAALQAGSYDGHLRVATALRLAAVLPFALRNASLEAYQQVLGKVGTPAVVLEDLEGVLNTAIDELTRPIDTIKHQAKSVTVGISRAEDSLLSSLLVSEVLAAGAPRDRLSYATLQTLAALDPAVEAVTGYTRYRIDGEVTADSGALHEATIDLTRQPATINVIDRGGIARDIASRTSSDSRLRGTKHRAAFEKAVTVGRGSDGRTVIHIPETKDGRAIGLTLLHCRFASTIAAHRMRAVLRGYRGRYGALVDAVTEALPAFRDDVLGRLDVVDLLTRPVYVLAESWIESDATLVEVSD